MKRGNFRNYRAILALSLLVITIFLIYDYSRNPRFKSNDEKLDKIKENGVTVTVEDYPDHEDEFDYEEIKIFGEFSETEVQ